MQQQQSDTPPYAENCPRSSPVHNVRALLLQGNDKTACCRGPRQQQPYDMELGYRERYCGDFTMNNCDDHKNFFWFKAELVC